MIKINNFGDPESDVKNSNNTTQDHNNKTYNDANNNRANQKNPNN